MVKLTLEICGEDLEILYSLMQKNHLKTMEDVRDFLKKLNEKSDEDPDMKKLRKVRIEDLGLRYCPSLRKHGFETVGDLMEYNGRFEDVRNAGRRTVDELNATIKELGYKYRFKY